MKIKKIAVIAALLACVLLLSSCTLDEVISFVSEFEQALSDNPAGTTSPDTTDAGTTEEPKETFPAFTVKFDENEVFTSESMKTASGIVDASIRAAVDGLNSAISHKDIPEVEMAGLKPAAKFRDKLGDLEKQLYDEMLENFTQMKDFYYNPYDYGSTGPFDSKFVTALLTARDALYRDYTRIFMYADTRSQSNIDYSCYFMPNEWLVECKDKDAIRAAVDVFDKVIDRIFAFMPEGLTNTQKTYYFARVISDLVTYDESLDSRMAQFQPYEALVKKSCVCQGYARTLEYLCKLAKIDVCCVTGEAPGGGAHMWNRTVGTDGKYYFIDVTWADSETYFRDWYFLMSEAQLTEEGYTEMVDADY